MERHRSLKVNAVLNVLRQICSIIFPMISFPYVSRVLEVETYGKVNTANSFISYLALVAGLGVYSYGVREGAKIRDNKNEFQIFSSEVVSINIISTLISYVLLAVLLVVWPRLYPYKWIMIVLSINVLFTTVGADWINVVYEDYLYMTIRYIICQLIAVVCTFVFIKGPEDVLIYAFVVNLGTTLSYAMNLAYIRKKLGIKIKFTFRVNAKKHLQPIMILFGNAISTMIYLYSDTSMLGLMVGDIAVGYYAVAGKIYELLKKVINAVTAVVTPRLSYKLGKNKDLDISLSVSELLGVLVVLLLPLVAGVLFVGKELIIILAGYSYEKAYSALAILGIALVFSTIGSVYISVVMLSYGMDKQIMLATTISAMINVILNVIFIKRYSYVAVSVTTLISEMLLMIMGIIFTRGVVKIRIKSDFIVGIIGAVWVTIVCIGVKNVNLQQPILVILISFVASVLPYGLLVLVYERKRIRR
ncbi:flippase [Butyrivibrio sp. FCS014]|uniref:flippase n=1 Tax=Butyrivibrio sp. FCS014 TaxID=1408304 RepID=UPI0004638C0C|nr:flippase [Butyrivibrio sp. FCS014]